METPEASIADWQYVGTRLKAQRETLKIAPAEIAKQLCLRVKQVEAMELGDTLPFPGAAARFWCIKRYANIVGLDWQTLLINPIQNETAASVQPDVVCLSAKPVHVASSVEPAPPKQVTTKTQSAEEKTSKIPKVLSETTNALPKQYILGAAISFVVLVLTFVAIRTLGHTQKSEVFTPKAGTKDSVSIEQQEDFTSALTTQPAASDIVSTVKPEFASARTEQISPLPNAEQVNPSKSPPTNVKSVVVNPNGSTTSLAKNEMIEFYGVDPNKQSGSFYINARNAVTLIKKSHDDPGDGVSIELPRGTEHRIPITESEVIRVAQGESFTVYYQGQMVPFSALRSGKWVRLRPRQENQ